MTTKTGFTLSPESEEYLEVRAMNISGSRQVELRVQRRLPAGTLARTAARRLSLPGDSIWALRDESSSAYLDDTRPVGEQVRSGARLRLSPRSHLGGGKEEVGCCA